jgi:hypothetical protein
MNNIEEFFLVNKKQWLMSIGERLTICGIASLLHPSLILELGVYLGKCSEQLAKLASIVYCIDPLRPKELSLPTNCHFIQLTSDDFFSFVPQHVYDLIIIDANHNIINAYRDLINSITYGAFIIMHDTANPECRSGYTKAIDKCKNNIKFYDLDLLPYSYISKEKIPWGGIGIVIPK